MRLNDAKAVYLGDALAKKVHLGDKLIWPKPIPPSPPIPSSYKLLEAIEAPSRVDGRTSLPLTLNYYYRTITKLVIDFVPLFDDYGYTIFSSPYASSCSIRYNNSYSEFYISNNASSKGGENIRTDNMPVIGERYILTTGNNYCSFDSDFGNDFTIETQKSIEYDTPHSGGNELKIFGSSQPPAHIRCHSIKIYEDEEIMLDLYPVKRIFDSAIGFYDVVNDKFYSLYGSYVEIPK